MPSRPDDTSSSLLAQENTRQTEFKKSDQFIKQKIHELEGQIKNE